MPVEFKLESMAHQHYNFNTTTTTANSNFFTWNPNSQVYFGGKSKDWYELMPPEEEEPDEPALWELP